ncbi:alanine racemase [candidate division GN15 bacterium]|uniref:Alanine racemase n=1 Tax=candidate division GN15 bacterium TaxID=2072418 RepID=A0A855X2Y9_9BACT|nr:MAG: alanine racemase [candidate division GN15 bacterium]
MGSGRWQVDTRTSAGPPPVSSRSGKTLGRATVTHPGCMLFPEIETPALLIEQQVLLHNIEMMQRLADRHGVTLRPHIKTHKSIQIARMQLTPGACGIAVAKLSEAETMVRGGIHNIQIANQVVGASRVKRLLDLARLAQVSCSVDSPENVRELSEAFSTHGRTLSVLVEVDTGLHRCGLSDPEEIGKLCRLIDQCDGLQLAGIMTHAGHAYRASSAEEVAQIGRQEGEAMVNLAESLRREGFHVEQVSVGSTPTALHAAAVFGVTELRVGNYVFNDMIQVSLGVAAEDQCALSVLATVTSLPTNDRVVLDAGSKSLTTELGAHGNQRLTGFGKIIGTSARITRLSEEHGIIEGLDTRLRLGDRVRIIPNHACATVNLYDYAYIVDGESVRQQVPIDARGCVT